MTHGRSPWEGAEEGSVSYLPPRGQVQHIMWSGEFDQISCSLPGRDYLVGLVSNETENSTYHPHFGKRCPSDCNTTTCLISAQPKTLPCAKSASDLGNIPQAMSPERDAVEASPPTLASSGTPPRRRFNQLLLLPNGPHNHAAPRRACWWEKAVLAIIFLIFKLAFCWQLGITWVRLRFARPGVILPSEQPHRRNHPASRLATLTYDEKALDMELRSIHPARQPLEWRPIRHHVCVGADEQDGVERVRGSSTRLVLPSSLPITEERHQDPT